jgi:hypothetical protein
MPGASLRQLPATIKRLVGRIWRREARPAREHAHPPALCYNGWRGEREGQPGDQFAMTILRALAHLIAACLIAVLLAWPPGPAAADETDFQRIISEQIAAFQADDGAKAFSFAAPVIRQKFAAPDIFMQMVKTGYAPVYRPRSYAFGAVTKELNGRPTQRVRIIDEQGLMWTALYAFEQQPDGSWLIAGVVLVREPGGEV